MVKSVEEFIDSVLKDLREDPSDPVFWSRDEIFGWLTEALHRACEQAPILESHLSISLDEDDNHLIEVPVDIVLNGYIRIKLGDNEITRNKVSFADRSLSVSAITGWGFKGLSHLFFSPIARGNTALDIYYQAYSQPLDDSLSSILPTGSPRVHELMECFVKYKAFEKIGDSANIKMSLEFKNRFEVLMDNLLLRTENLDDSFIMGGNQ